MTTFEQLSKIRELVDELYDNTQPHTSTNSMLFLEINQAIDEAQSYIRKCEAGSLYGKMTQSDTEYINGTDLDWNNEEQIRKLMNENRRIY